jgi:hypothetical protein
MSQTTGPVLADQLKSFSQCIKCIMLVADMNTFDALLNDQNYKATLGALEYLPGLNKGLLIRDFFD